MNYIRQDQGTSSEFIIADLLTLEDAQELKPQLLDALENKEKILLNFKGQEAIGIHGLQLLCSAHRSAAKLHKELLLVNCSDPLLRLVHQVGFVRRESCLPGIPDNCLWACGSGSARPGIV